LELAPGSSDLVLVELYPTVIAHRRLFVFVIVKIRPLVLVVGTVFGGLVAKFGF
jgi:hypothetical protein